MEVTLEINDGPNVVPLVFAATVVCSEASRCDALSLG
jgi:hypothetical protein